MSEEKRDRLKSSQKSSTESQKPQQKKVQGKEVPENSDELLMQIANSQLRADYRKSLGKEYARRSWDFEIKKAISQKKDPDEKEQK
jgi:hypothetical protein